MISRPTHPPDDARGPGDSGIAELAPVIATIEELVQGIARELSANLAPPSLPSPLTAKTPDVSSLAQDLDAAGARIRELREQLWYAQATTQAGTDSTDQSSDHHDTRLARYRDLEPLFMRLESQIRQARQDLHLREKRDAVEPSRMKSPWLPVDAAAPPATKPGAGRSAGRSNDEAVSSSVDENDRRQRWLGIAAAAALLIATAVGTWLATRDVRQEAQSAAIPADRPTVATSPSPPASTSPATAAAEPARPSPEPPAIDRPVESGPVATATSGSFPARPPSDAGSDAAAPSAVKAAQATTTQASARTANPVATTTSSDPGARPAVNNPTGPETNRPAEPTQSRAAVDATPTPSPPPPVVGTREDTAAPSPVTPSPVAPSAIAPPSAAGTRPSDAAPTPPAEVIARAEAAPARPEDVARTAPPAEAPRADAPTGDAETSLLNRPAAVVNRVQPRMMVEMISADMAAGVELRVRVDRTGRATDVRAVSGPVALRAPAEDTVRRWTFSPAVQNGEPVDGELLVTLNFGASPRNLRLPRRSP